MRNAGALGA